MKIIYAQQQLPKSIFLAGPTPRSKDVKSWRPEALKLLENLGFDGTVFVPECETFEAHQSYDHQVFWEWEGLNQCTIAVFWVPRELETMPALTTNVEFGMMVASSKVVLGYPTEAPKMRYLHTLGARFNVPVFHTLQETLQHAVNRCEDWHPFHSF
jgi:nucleoside 2-deoxyribosyltransferase